MKRAVVFFILLLPISVFAENTGEMTDEQMQKMMQQSEGLLACMQNIDQSEIQAFEQREKQMHDEIQALCTEGKRDEAMQKAMTFGKEVSNTKAIQEMKKCGEGMKDMMPKMAVVAQNDANGKPRHICDDL